LTSRVREALRARSAEAHLRLPLPLAARGHALGGLELRLQLLHDAQVRRQRRLPLGLRLLNSATSSLPRNRV
jgi:hypothetical protein